MKVLNQRNKREMQSKGWSLPFAILAFYRMNLIKMQIPLDRKCILSSGWFSDDWSLRFGCVGFGRRTFLFQEEAFMGETGAATTDIIAEYQEMLMHFMRNTHGSFGLWSDA